MTKHGLFSVLLAVSCLHAAGAERQQPHVMGVNAIEAGLRLDDPKLEDRYRAFFQGIDGRGGGPGTVLEDIQNRGESITGLLLKLFDENSEGAVRENILFFIDEFPALPRGPFLERTRKLLQHDPKIMGRRACVSFARFLSKHGSNEDVLLLEGIIAADPQGEIGPRVAPHLKVLKKRVSASATK